MTYIKKFRYHYSIKKTNTIGVDMAKYPKTYYVKRPNGIQQDQRFA